MFACLDVGRAPLPAVRTLAERFTPRFAVVGPLLVMDLTGVARLFGSADDIGAHVSRALAGMTASSAGSGTPPERVALAATQTAAILLALGHPGLTVAVEDQVHRLAPLPVTALAEWEQIAHDHALSTRQASPASRRRPSGDDSAVLLDALGHWGIRTLGALAALPPDEIAGRLGPRGARWRRLALGEDDRPFVPLAPDESFESSMTLDWPIDGREPLSFVLARLLDPLAARLERAGRGAAALTTMLGLVTRDVWTRTLQLPAPMHDARTLRALVLLDLESHPPPAAIDRVSLVIEPTPARVLQWELFERARPSPEQVSTVLARLTALMGEGRVGSPQVVDGWKPGAFDMAAFEVPAAQAAPDTSPPPPAPPPTAKVRVALRRFRLPIPARVTVHDGRPVRVQSDRHGVPGGAVREAAGPWRTSGHWWTSGPEASRRGSSPSLLLDPWDRDEWDVELASGIVCRIYVERTAGQWFIEGVMD